VARGYTQIYGSDHSNTFSVVAKMTIVCLLIAVATLRHRPLHQLDIKNVFFHVDLEVTYIKQPLRFVAQGEHGLVLSLDPK